MDIDFELTHLPNTVKLYWDSLAKQTNLTSFEAASELGYILMCEDCLVVDDPLRKCSIVTGESVDQVIEIAIKFIKSFQ